MFEELFKLYVKNFQDDGEPALVAMCNCTVPAGVVLSMYKKLPAIETLPKKRKG